MQRQFDQIELKSKPLLELNGGQSWRRADFTLQENGLRFPTRLAIRPIGTEFPWNADLLKRAHQNMGVVRRLLSRQPEDERAFGWRL